MSISSPNQESIQWAQDISKLPYKKILNAFNDIRVDENFIHKITALLHIIKSGNTDFDGFHYGVSNDIIDALHNNEELECIGTGSYSSCFKTLDNKVFKINLMSDKDNIDAAISYAIACHDNNNPLVPVIYNICSFENTYVIETEFLNIFQRRSLDYIPLNQFDEIIQSKDIEKFNLNVNAIHKAELFETNIISIEHCSSFINIIEQAKKVMKKFRTKTARMDIGDNNLMWRGEQLVFNDPIF